MDIDRQTDRLTDRERERERKRERELDMNGFFYKSPRLSLLNTLIASLHRGKITSFQKSVSYI